jgi:hypothetical protein
MMRARHYDQRMRPSLRLAAVLGSAALVAACSGGSDEPVEGDADRGSETTAVTGTATEAGQGGCQDQVNNSAATADHEDPGTEMSYDGVPPASGVHWAEWEDLTVRVYEADERPEMGELVHSQEHGWTMVWYDETLADDEAAMAEVQAAADAVNAAGVTKVVFVPWTSDDGDAFPDDMHVAMSHWGGGEDETEYRQYCATVHPDAVLAFAERNPYTDSREPNAP